MNYDYQRDNVRQRQCIKTDNMKGEYKEEAMYGMYRDLSVDSIKGKRKVDLND